jgi:hypothetical protein
MHNKGPDHATMEIQQRDKVSEFRDSQYIAASEAAWRLFRFPIHSQQPNVIQLQVHLPGQHLTVFGPSLPVETVLQCANGQMSMLTAFFVANQLYLTLALRQC